MFLIILLTFLHVCAGDENVSGIVTPVHDINSSITAILTDTPAPAGTNIYINSASSTLACNLSTGEQRYFGHIFHTIYQYYGPMHGYVSLVICIIGIVVNIIIIIVLTRRELKSPTNMILTGIAIADLFVMLEYIPYTIISHIIDFKDCAIDDRKRYTSHQRVAYYLFHVNYFFTTRDISTMLHVVLAFWRHKTISCKTPSGVWHSVKHAIIMTAVTAAVVPVILIPLYLTYAVKERQVVEEDGGEGGGRNITFYTTGYSTLALLRNGLLVKIMFWLTSCFLKIVPCVAMTILSLLLTRQLQQSSHRRRQLMTPKSSIRLSLKRRSTAASVASTASSTTTTTGQQADQKTRMLLVILLCYLASVLPFGLTVPLVGLIGRTFKINFFDPLFIVFDLLALSNSLTVFILLISMSRLFRQTLYKLFPWPWGNLLHRFSPHTARKSSTTAETITSISAHPTRSADDSKITALILQESKSTQTSVSSLGKLIMEFDRTFSLEC